MLMTTCKILFYECNDEYHPNGGYTAKGTLRPPFKFVEGLLFSGTIKTMDISLETFLFEKEYIVDVDFYTIEDEAYEALKPYLKIGMNLIISLGSKAIGEAKLLDYEYGE